MTEECEWRRTTQHHDVITQNDDVTTKTSTNHSRRSKTLSTLSCGFSYCMRTKCTQAHVIQWVQVTCFSAPSAPLAFAAARLTSLWVNTFRFQRKPACHKWLKLSITVIWTMYDWSWMGRCGVQGGRRGYRWEKKCGKKSDVNTTKYKHRHSEAASDAEGIYKKKWKISVVSRKRFATFSFWRFQNDIRFHKWQVALSDANRCVINYTRTMGCYSLV